MSTFLNRVCPACHGDGLLRHRGTTWFEDCPTCAGHGYMSTPAEVTLSEIALTAADRARVRREARFRKDYALNPQGQQNSQHKQRRQNVQD